MFIITVLIMSPLGWIGGATAEVAVVVASGFGLLHFFKAYIEEVVWAGTINKYMGVYYSSVTFMLFHVTVKVLSASMNFLPILILGGLRFLWDYMAKRYGIMGSTGSHFGYNTIISGLGD
jgi:hypothetical protein